MTDDDRPQPQTTVQAVGRVAEDVVTGFKGQPLLLAIVVLNVIGIVAALYFLNLLAQNNSMHLRQLMEQTAQHFEAVVKLCTAVPGQYRLQSDPPPTSGGHQ